MFKMIWKLYQEVKSVQSLRNLKSSLQNEISELE